MIKINVIMYNVANLLALIRLAVCGKESQCYMTIYSETETENTFTHTI